MKCVISPKNLTKNRESGLYQLTKKAQKIHANAGTFAAHSH